MKIGKILLSVSLLAGASAAMASISVIGGDDAHACYQAAEFNQSIRVGLGVCNSALTTDALTVEERASTLVNRGIVYMHGRNLSAALADFDMAIKLRPQLAEAYVNKGIALINLGGRDAEAIAALTAGLVRNPSRPEVAYYTRGVANELIGATREAFEDFKAAVALKPDWQEASEQLQRFSVVRRASATS